MRITPFLCALVALVALADSPLMTPMPGAPISPSEQLKGIVSTQARDCVRRDNDCTHKPCCERQGKCRAHGPDNDWECR